MDDSIHFSQWFCQQQFYEYTHICINIVVSLELSSSMKYFACKKTNFITICMRFMLWLLFYENLIHNRTGIKFDSLFPYSFIRSSSLSLSRSISITYGLMSRWLFPGLQQQRKNEQPIAYMNQSGRESFDAYAISGHVDHVRCLLFSRACKKCLH